MAAVPGSKPALHPLTADDRGPIIIILAYGWIFITAVIAVIRFGLAWKRKLPFKDDDATFLVGVTFAAASSVCFHIAVNHGLGRRLDNVSPANLDKYYRAMYAGELLSIAAMTSAKSSAVLLSHRVAPRERRPLTVMLGLVAIWAVFSMFATAFECGLPHPWVFNLAECPSKGALNYPIIALNIVTDALLAVWILPTLWKLLMSKSKRLTAMALFGSRIIVCIFAIVQLVSVARDIREPDITYSAFGRILWLLCVMHLSVLQATAPRTNSFISALQSDHTTTRLTDFELGPSHGLPPVLPKEESYVTEATMTATADTQTRPRSESDPRTKSRSHSLSRSDRSQQQLMDAPLVLTPSVERGFSTYIISNQAAAQVGKKQSRTSHKCEGSDWKNCLCRRGNKGSEAAPPNRFSWKSRRSSGQKHIMQTKEVTQQVEVASPVQSRWVVPKLTAVRRN